MMLLDYLRTPMAAPETTVLRAMRLLLLGSFVVLALLTIFIGAARAAIGDAAPGVVLGLGVVIVVLGPIYLGMKNRADDAHLSAMLRRGGDA